MEIKETIFIIQLLCAGYIYSQGNPGVWTNGKYSSDYTVLDCFKNSKYQGIFKADTIKSNYVLKGQKIWRTINLENKENQRILNSTSKCHDIGLFEIIKYGLFQKKLNAFSSDNFNETKSNHLTETQLLSMIIFSDSSITSVFDSDGNEKREVSITKRYMYGSDIKSFLMKENWIINNYSGQLEKIIIGIAPLIYDKKTSKIVPLFWIYYPEWKELFASFEAKNYYSDEPITFNDVFTRKLFISLISKENNTFDRSVKATNHGKDFYLESELIKERVINYEEDLFHH